MLPTPSHLAFNNKIPGGLDTKSDFMDFSFKETFWDDRV